MDLRDLYQDVIIDHNKSPRNFRRIENAERKADGFNPLCGDKLTVYLQMNSDKILDISFEGTGCAISVASASMMTEALMGKTESEARTFFHEIHALLTDDNCSADIDRIGKLASLEGVKAYPSRVKCASLCWHTVNAALDMTDKPVTTE